MNFQPRLGDLIKIVPILFFLFLMAPSFAGEASDKISLSQLTSQAEFVCLGNFVRGFGSGRLKFEVRIERPLKGDLGVKTIVFRHFPTEKILDFLRTPRPCILFLGRDSKGEFYLFKGDEYGLAEASDVNLKIIQETLRSTKASE